MKISILKVMGFETLPKQHIIDIEAIIRTRPGFYCHGHESGRAHARPPISLNEATVLRSAFQEICQKDVSLVEDETGFIFQLCAE